MSRATEKLLDLLDRSAWSTTVKVESVTDEMTIVPDTENGPMLRIAAKTKEGNVLHTREMNLAATDAMIGQLIKMRDHMARMKSGGG